MCHNPKFNCQKQKPFTPKKLQLAELDLKIQ